MSVRAYRLLKYAKNETFNLWHDEELMNYLEGRGGLNLNEDGAGLIEVSTRVLEEALKTCEIDDYTRKSIEKDIADVKAKGEDWLTYYCY